MPRAAGTSNPTEARILRIDALERKINGYIDSLIEAKTEIMEVVAAVKDGRLQTLLTLYYVNCLPTWDAVADRMGYSRAHVVKMLLPMALAAVEEILKDATQCYF